MTNAVLHTVIINTTDISALADFYGRGLNLGTASATGEDHLGFHLPNAYLGFDLAGKEPSKQPGPISLWFEVDDLDVTFSLFVELGAEVKYPPVQKPWGAVLAAVLDPDGNVVGLAQRGTSPQS